MYSRVSAFVDLDIIGENIYTIRSAIKHNVKIITVLKVDGYGHGAHIIAKELESIDYIFGYGLATVGEAISLKRHNIKKPILIYGYVYEHQFDTVVEQNFRICMINYNVAEQISMRAVKAGKTAYIHIEINQFKTLIFVDMIKEINKIAKLPNLEIEGIYLYLEKNEKKQNNSIGDQKELFIRAVSQIERSGIKIPYKYCITDNSFLEPIDSYCNLIQVNQLLYGISSRESERKIKHIKPVMELKSMIVYLKKVPKGDTISYGGEYTLAEDQIIATIPVGYGDGYPRSLSNTGYVLIHGEKAPIRGKVCMDQFMVDVTNIKGVKEGDKVTLFGEDNGTYLYLRDLEILSDRCECELVCMLGKRIPRIYTKNAKVVHKIDAFE